MKQKFRLENVDCANCAVELEEGLKKADFVRSVHINFATLSMRIDTSDMEKVKKLIKKIEPDVEVKDNSNHEEEHGSRKELIFILTGFLFFTFGLIFQKKLEQSPFHIAEYIVFISIYLASGWKILFSAAKNILSGQIFDENFLMSIATLGAVAIHALPEAAGVMLFYRFGEYLQSLAVNRSRRSIKALLEIRPDQANVKSADGSIKSMTPEEVAVDDIIVVRPGEKIPLDGIIIKGNTRIDTATLTGESLPRVAKEGKEVLAGTINLSSMIELKVTRLFAESSVSKILDMVENAAEKKAKTERFFTTFSKYYTPAVVLIAVLTAFVPPLFFGQTLSVWVYRALVILVISCPCALVVSIPLAFFGGIGTASRQGILLKGSDVLDNLRKVRTWVFDKTGTLTQGQFSVSQIVGKNDFSKQEVLRFAALAESHSNHPIAQSIRKAYKEQLPDKELQDYREISGKGVSAIFENQRLVVGNDAILHHFDIPHDVCHIPGTVVHVALDKNYIGYLVIGDVLKEDSHEALKALRKEGIRTVMLTGDNADIAQDIADKIGIDEVHANLLPEDKLRILEEIIRTGKKTAFVGDGVNDAPVLARADIGVSMGALGSDAAIETADMVIMNDSLTRISLARRISKKTARILIQNIGFALFIKLFFIIFGVAGLANMWEAVFADVGVTLLSVLNASRILRMHGEDTKR